MRQEDGRLGGRRRDEGRQDHVDDEEADEDVGGVLTELEEEPQGEPPGQPGLDQHAGQDERHDVEPHHGVPELRVGLLLGQDPREHQADDHDQGCQVVGERVGHPEDDGGREHGQHRVFGCGRTPRRRWPEGLLGRSLDQAGGVDLLQEGQLDDEPQQAERDRGQRHSGQGQRLLEACLGTASAASRSGSCPCRADRTGVSRRYS